MNTQNYICSFYCPDERGNLRGDVLYSNEYGCYVINYYDEQDSLVWAESVNEVSSVNEHSFILS
mgnify:CR=1 FL=1